MPNPAPRCSVLRLLTLVAATAGSAPAARPDGNLEIRVIEAPIEGSGGGTPLPARMHLRDARDRAVRKRGLGLAAHGDHFYLDGATTLGLRRGRYTFLIDAGWERRTQSSERPFEIERRAEDSKTLEMRRFANLAEEGWHAADVDAGRPLRDLGVVVRAEGLAYAPLTVWRAGWRGWEEATTSAAAVRALPESIGLHGARVDSPGGPLLFFRSEPPVNPAELPTADAVTIESLRAARGAGYRVVAADPTSWSLPVWLAADVIDAACVIDRSSRFTGVDAKAGGRPLDRSFFPGKRGPGRWREAIYFHTLNAGLRLPPVAGSGSGDTDSPLGTNRVYAHLPAHAAERFVPADWWEAVDAGRTVVTNGPLLRPLVFGQPPGYVFTLDESGGFSASIALNLSTRSTVEYLEMIQDGEVVASVGLRDWASRGGRLPELDFTASGWFAVRAVTGEDSRYQLALTAPYYVEGDRARISRDSCQFFLDWLDDYKPRASAGWQREELALAREYWRKKLAAANAP